jgi:hypothetical protein
MLVRQKVCTQHVNFVEKLESCHCVDIGNKMFICEMGLQAISP